LGLAAPLTLDAVVPPCSCSGGAHEADSGCFERCPCGAQWGELVDDPSAKKTVIFYPQYIHEASQR
jgi:hypothetical protein